MHMHEITTSRPIGVRGRPHDDQDAFAVRTDCRHVWLQRACCWLLRKLGAFRRDRHDPQVRYTTIRIDKDCIIEYLQNHKTDLEILWGKQSWRVVLGRDAAHELWGTLASREPWCHTTEVRIGRGQVQEVFGMRIQVVPWIKGAFLLPEVISNR